jgi:hypothetical protein
MSTAQALDQWSWSDSIAAQTIDAALRAPMAVSTSMLGRTDVGFVPEWVNVFQQRIAELHGLRRDWDGRGSAAVRPDALFFAYSVLGQSMAPATVAPSVIPLGHGGVQMVWSSADADVEVEVVQPNEVIIYHLDKASGTEREWHAATEFSDLSTLLRAVFTR